MANITVINVDYPSETAYRKVLDAAGHNVEYIVYRTLNELKELLQRDFYYADLLILRSRMKIDTERLLTFIRRIPGYSHTPILLIGRATDNGSAQKVMLGL
jgi:hypothetical protein